MYPLDASPAGEKRALLESRARDNSSPQAVLAALTDGLAPGVLLRAIAVDPQWLAQVAGNSHRHDNGFDKIVLFAPADGSVKLVLHVWWVGNGRDGIDNIHNHRWDFASLVLCGAVRTELYDDDPSGKTYPVLHYSSPGSGSSYTTIAAGERRVAIQATMSLAAGSNYVWGKDLLHRAWGVEAPLTATLIVQGRPERATTTVLTRSGDPTAESEPRPLHRLDTGDVARALTAVAARLAP